MGFKDFHSLKKPLAGIPWTLPPLLAEYLCQLQSHLMTPDVNISLGISIGISTNLSHPTGYLGTLHLLDLLYSE